MSQVNCRNHPTMKQEFFKNLSSETVIDILSRLPVRSVISCKCVQKSWRHLVETQEFVKSHFSKSVPGLITCENFRQEYKLFELENGLDAEHHNLHYKLTTKLDLTPADMKMMGSANGLIFLHKQSPWKPKDDALCICNPVTRDCISIDCPQEFSNSFIRAVTYGFGSSKITCQYKLVRISHDCTYNQQTEELLKSSEVECHVYTLGTGLWRRLASCVSLTYINASIPRTGVFVDGNLHWLVCDLVGCLRISCFDLETEQFITLSLPPLHRNGRPRSLITLELFAWGDCLGLCDNSTNYESVIWLMKEYGVEELWTKEFVISNVRIPGFTSNRCYPIKVFKDGDILFQWNEHYVFHFLFYYSSKNKTIQKVDMSSAPSCAYRIAAFLHTPSFLSLKSFGLDVSSF